MNIVPEFSLGCVIIALSCFIYYYINRIKYWSPLDKIPGPKPLPFIGNGLDLFVDHTEVTNLMLKWVEEYPNNFKIWLLGYPYIVLYKASDVEAVLSSTTHIDKSYDYEFLRPWLGTGLLTSNGSKWHKRRKMLTPAFHFRILEDFVSVFNEQSEILIKKLTEQCKYESVDIFPLITMCAMDIICDSVMGCHLNAQENSESTYVLALERIKNIIHSRQFRFVLWPDLIFNLTSLGREHNKCLKILHDFTDQVIKDRKLTFKSETKTINDQQDQLIGRKKRLAFLDLLIEASDDGKQLNDLDIREEVDTFMFEGHDTTAAAIGWCCYLLGTFPHFQKRIHEELDSIFGNDKSTNITMEHLAEMKYLDCAIKETLRLFPSVPLIARHLKKDIELDNHKIPAGTTAIIILAMLHRDTEMFTDAEFFNPDQFLPENLQHRHPYCYVPFSAGSRNCIGQKFAMMELKIVLAWILRAFEIKSLQDVDTLKIVAELILKPNDGIIVSLTPR